MATAPDPLPRRARAQARARPHGAPDRPARPPRRRSSSTSHAPDVVDGPDPQRPAARARRGPPGRQGSSRRSRWSRERPCPRPSIAQKTKSAAGSPLRAGRRRVRRRWSLRSCWRHAAAPGSRRRAVRREAQRRMIVTVTLNTAIDKTLSVPNFRLGRRHRTVEQTTMPGGKGVNVARVLKTLGAPVIATGLAGGATGTRIVDQLTQLSVLSDFVRIGEESRTNTAVIDPTTGEQTEINERGPEGHAARGRAVRRQAALPGQGRERVRVRGLAPARRRHRHLRAPDPRAAAAGRHDRGRHRRRPAAPRGARRARRDLAERARGRGARRPRVQRRRGPHVRRRARCASWARARRS